MIGQGMECPREILTASLAPVDFMDRDTMSTQEMSISDHAKSEYVFQVHKVERGMSYFCPEY